MLFATSAKKKKRKGKERKENIDLQNVTNEGKDTDTVMFE